MKPVPFVGHPVHAFISKRWSPRAFADKAIEKGMMTLRMVGLEKIKEGISSLEEVLSVTGGE